MKPAIGARRSSRGARVLVMGVAVLAVAAACSGGQETKTLRAGGASSSATEGSSVPADGPTTSVAGNASGATPTTSSNTGAGADTGSRSPSAGAGSSQSQGGASQQQGGDTGPGGTGTQPPGDRQPDPPPGPHKTARSYPSGGAVDQVFPPGTPAFYLLAHGECTELLRQIDVGNPSYLDPTVSDPDAEPQNIPRWPTELPEYHLYRSAAEACLSQWDPARADFDVIPLPIECFGDACAPRQQVYDWVAGLLHDHDADPDFVPDFP